MLIKLLPQNITANWDTIKYAIEHSLPPTIGESIDKMNRILESLLAGDLECWVQSSIVEGHHRILSIGTTKINMDTASQTKALIMYSVFNFRPMTDKEWLENFMTLRKYAESKGCARMIAFTDSKRMIDLAVKFGGETKYTLCSFPTNPL